MKAWTPGRTTICPSPLTRVSCWPASTPCCAGNTALDLSAGILRCGEAQIRLSAKEFGVMRQLMQAGERHVSKELLLERVWGFESNAVENHVEVYVGFLRKKLRSIGSDVRIEAVRRLGYHLEADG